MGETEFTLAVEEESRREDVAVVERGLDAFNRDTQSFHAPSFYEWAGHAVDGELADFPPGHRRLFLSERLAQQPDGTDLRCTRQLGDRAAAARLLPCHSEPPRRTSLRRSPV